MSTARPAYWTTAAGVSSSPSRPLSEIIDEEQQEQLKQQFQSGQPGASISAVKEVDQFSSTPYTHPNLSGQTVTPVNPETSPGQHGSRVRAAPPPPISGFSTAAPAEYVSPSYPPPRFRNSAMGATDDDGSVFSFLVNTPTSAHPAASITSTPDNARIHSADIYRRNESPSRDDQSGLGSYSSATAAALASQSSLYGAQSLIRSINQDLSDSDYDEDDHEYDEDRNSFASSNNDTSNSILNPRDHLNSVFIQDPEIIATSTGRQSITSPPPGFPLPTSPNPHAESHELSAIPDRGIYNQPSQETVVSKSQRLNQTGAVTTTFNDSIQEKPVVSRLSESSSRYNDLDKTGVALGAGTGANFGPVDDDHTDVGLFKSTGAAASNAPDGDGAPQANNGSLWKRRKKLCILIALALLVIILVAVLVPVGVVVIGKDNDSNTNKSSNNSGSSSPSSPSSTSTSSTSSSSTLPSNLKGSIYDISTWADKTDFNTTYTSATVGGLPVMGLNSTWDNSVAANPTVPTIDSGFTYGDLPIRGVNLGGWLVLEPFITPSLFNYSLSEGVVDEWTLIDHVNSTSGMSAVVDLMETHYSTFVTESTFKEVQAAGLDHVRIPFGYWAVQTYEGDHFLAQISWRYLLRGIEWARKYGLRVNIDLHSVPGGQNGWNHSGRQGVVQWLNGTDGLLNGQRTLDIHSKLSQFFAQDRYKNLVTIYGLVNEPRMQDLNETLVIEWTKNATQVVRDGGYNGVVVFGDGFLGVDTWKGIYPEDEYPDLALDVHQYTIFDVNLLAMSHSAKINYVCAEWLAQIKRSSNNETGHGPTLVGEWSQADNDCTLYLNNVGVGSRWEGDYVPANASLSVTTPTCNGGVNCSCNVSNSDPSLYSSEYKQFLLDFAEVQMEVFESNGGWGSMYWAWDTETIESSQWSYKKARDAGIMPQTAYNRTFNCSSGTPDYLALGLSEGV